jgi:DNA polymerase III subunit epsilon
MSSASSAPIQIAGRAGVRVVAPEPRVIVPERFVVLDLETTGLDPDANEIIEMGAIRVNRGTGSMESLSLLVRPRQPIPALITGLTGITQQMVDEEGHSLEDALARFLHFIGNLPLVAYAVDFDLAFLTNALKQANPSRQINNPAVCALKMTRRAWPFLNSYRLSDVASDGAVFAAPSHRALGDCERTLLVYYAAASELEAAN